MYVPQFDRNLYKTYESKTTDTILRMIKNNHFLLHVPQEPSPTGSQHT